MKWRHLEGNHRRHQRPSEDGVREVKKKRCRLTMKRQTTKTPIIETASPVPERAWPKVAIMMIMSSTPSVSEIWGRIWRQARQDTYTSFYDQQHQPTNQRVIDQQRFQQELRPWHQDFVKSWVMDLSQHRTNNLAWWKRCWWQRCHTWRNIKNRLMYNLYGTYASVKKPTPATTQTLAWNQLRGSLDI